MFQIVRRPSERRKPTELDPQYTDEGYEIASTRFPPINPEKRYVNLKMEVELDGFKKKVWTKF